MPAAPELHSGPGTSWLALAGVVSNPILHRDRLIVGTIDAAVHAIDVASAYGVDASNRLVRIRLCFIPPDGVPD